MKTVYLVWYPLSTKVRGVKNTHSYVSTSAQRDTGRIHKKLISAVSCPGNRIKWSGQSEMRHLNVYRLLFIMVVFDRYEILLCKTKYTFHGDPYDFIVIAVKNNNCIVLFVALLKTLSLKTSFTNMFQQWRRSVPILYSSMPSLLSIEEVTVNLMAFYLYSFYCV